MHRTTIFLLLLATCLMPLASIAGQVELAELGIAVRELPELVAKPTVHERPRGYEASARFGAYTTLTVYRQDDPVTQGSLEDSGYRATVLAPLGDPQDWKDTGRVAALGGHEAWITSHVTRLGPMSADRITLYTVVDRCLYRVIVTAMGAKPPPEFDAVVKAIQADATFEPVRRPVELEWTAAEHPDRVPRFVGESMLLYPDASRRRQEQGAVDVEFSIDGHGRVTDFKQLKTPYRDLGERLPELFSRGVFRVPRDWEETGSDKRRFTREFRFLLVPTGSACPPSPAPANSPTEPEVTYVCATSLPGK